MFNLVVLYSFLSCKSVEMFVTLVKNLPHYLFVTMRYNDLSYYVI
jgi:hypothetical protein